VTNEEQLKRFGQAVERKKEESKKASERSGKGPPDGSEVLADQPELPDAARPQDTASAREKSAGKGKKTADKWNQ
jgi:hypothetical protein